MLFDAGCVICGTTPGPVCCPCAAGLTSAGTLQVPGIDACRVGFTLNDDSRTIVAAFKYRRQRRIARWLGGVLGPLVPRCADVITWVPATPERRRSRGFDQAQELALALSACSGVPAIGLLGRDQADQRQTGRSRHERLAGPILHAVRAAPAFVVLVDDVITTGSSMGSAAHVIRAASATNGTQRIVGVAAAATPATREDCLHELTNRSSIREWT